MATPVNGRIRNDNVPPPADARSAFGEPVRYRRGDEYWCDWPDYLCRLRFTGVHETREALRAEVTIYLDIEGAPSPIEWTAIDLASSDSRNRIAGRLRQQWEGPGAPPYGDMLLDASYWVRETFLGGEQVQRISGHRTITTARQLLHPLLPEGQTTILYGDGASLKSMIAASVALSVNEERDLLPGTHATAPRDTSRQGPCLYLDYETNLDEQHSRIQRLAAGFGLASYREVLYRECHVPLPRDAATLRALVDEHRCRLVVVDSLGAAMGSDPNDAAATIAAMNALRSLKTTVLCIDHVTKTDEQGRPFGSAYKFNYSRAAWHAKRVQEQDSDVVNVALIHKKANNGRLVSPLGFTVRFPAEEDGPITMRALDIRDDPDLAEHASVPSRIKRLLGHGPMKREDVKHQIGDNLRRGTFDNAVKRLRDSGQILEMQGGILALRTDRTP